jgi:lipopolysaccharide/colanic/teichoic acid biosynthesis glycosyltransferase
MKNLVWRRVGDLLTASMLIAVTWPFLALIAFAIKLDSPGPIFYRQERVGLGGRRFIIMKFRSMVRDAEPYGHPVWAAERDIRITRVGRFLRCTRLDELPQVLNVLWGDMSIVGPRPERPYFVDQITKIIPSFSERLKVNPGITGWAQVNYPYSASIEDARKKLFYDLYYIRNRNMVLDLIILFFTVRVVILQKGAR